MNSLVAALELTKRDTGLDIIKLQKISDYWGEVRKYYSQFESGMRSGSAEIYKYEIPGGQYSNLKPQVESFGLGHKFEEVKKMYATVNEMLGDIVKVTPSSKPSVTWPSSWFRTTSPRTTSSKREEHRLPRFHRFLLPGHDGSARRRLPRRSSEDRPQG